MGQTLKKLIYKKKDKDQYSSSPYVIDDPLHAERPTLENQEYSRNLLGDKIQIVVDKDSDQSSDPELVGLLLDQDDRKEPEDALYREYKEDGEDLGFKVDLALFESSPSENKESSSEESCTCRDNCKCSDDCRWREEPEPESDTLSTDVAASEEDPDI